MRIMKFGGKALQTSTVIRDAIELIDNAQKTEDVAVVVSALDGVTDQLLKAAQSVLNSYDDTLEIFNHIHSRHLKLIEELIPPANRSSLVAEIQMLFHDLEDVLHGVHLVRECSPASQDLILSYGTRLSSRILAFALETGGIPNRLIESRNLIVTFDVSTGKTMVHQDETYQRIRDHLLPYTKLCIIPGSIASQENGVTSNLGRKGGDFTATLFGAALDADQIEIWTDVNGIQSADPDLVPGSCFIDHMTYEEAQEMAFFGADIIHPQALQPTAEKNIPVKVRNIFNPNLPGTLISAGDDLQGGAVRGITTIDNVALVNLEGSGMIGIPGIAGRLFSALAEVKVNIIMISQASSEHSICFVVRQEELKTAADAVYKTFDVELKEGLIQRVEQLDNLAVLAIIGSRMRGTFGISGRFFGALGNHQINVLAISQGSSERNISIVISNRDKLTALKEVHAAFMGNCTECGEEPGTN